VRACGKIVSKELRYKNEQKNEKKKRKSKEDRSYKKKRDFPSVAYAAYAWMSVSCLATI